MENEPFPPQSSQNQSNQNSNNESSDHNRNKNNESLIPVQNMPILRCNNCGDIIPLILEDLQRHIRLHRWGSLPKRIGHNEE